MRIAIGADHAGYALKQHIGERLRSLGHEVADYGTDSPTSVDYPDYAVAACERVASGEAEYGVLVCGSGIGVSIAANKVKGIRAANCVTVEMAQLSRQHNNANVLTIGSRLVDETTADAIVDAFLLTAFEGGRHENRVAKIHLLTGC